MAVRCMALRTRLDPRCQASHTMPWPTPALPPPCKISSANYSAETPSRFQADDPLLGSIGLSRRTHRRLRLAGHSFCFCPRLGCLSMIRRTSSATKYPFPWQSFPTPLFAVSKDRFVAMRYGIHRWVRDGAHYLNCLRPAYHALVGFRIFPRGAPAGGLHHRVWCLAL